MTKQENIDAYHSCWNRAEEREQMFILLERDPAMAATIRFWADKRIDLGKNKVEDNQILSALALADRIEAKRVGL